MIPHELVIETCAKFFNSTRISGWIRSSEALKEVSVQPAVHQLSTLGQFENGVQRFEIQVLNDHSDFVWQMDIAYSLNGQILTKPLKPLIDAAVVRSAGDIDATWRDMIKESHKILDIGGRARSRLDRSKFYPDKDVTVFDIIPGDNVDVVGDAHELSKHFKPETFDAVYSVSVFEHLLQPWKVVLEINKVLRPGGLVLVHTHQTMGMHDMPWDFLRFSADSWDGFFNQRTGFEIVERASRQPSYIIPFLMRDGKENAENSAGFEGSTVIARKIGNHDAALNWPVSTTEAISTHYPRD